MPAYLFLWNPRKDEESFVNFDEVLRNAAAGRPYEKSWLCRSTQPQVGDAVFMQRTGDTNNGVFARGIVVKAPYIEHDGERVARVRLDSFLPLGREIPRASVVALASHEAGWKAQKSGDVIVEPLLAAIEALWEAGGVSKPLPAAISLGGRAGNGVVTTASGRQMAAFRMARTARETVAQSNGQQVPRTVKSKELRFKSQQEFEKYILSLIDEQHGVCAVSGLPLRFDGDLSDAELLCSLDRIDSGGHYEAGNLQVVCRFLNRWKNDGDDREFRRLLRLVKSVESPL